MEKKPKNSYLQTWCDNSTARSMGCVDFILLSELSTDCGSLYLVCHDGDRCSCGMFPGVEEGEGFSPGRMLGFMMLTDRTSQLKLYEQGVTITKA